ncbi:Urb2/Npa2 family-domain-containing protein [Chytridium lagenaria]|nr:Urb2/Npa2 family-domain-containing protein [Chytridium lagenaria]
MSCLLGGSVIVVSDCSEHGKVDSGIPYNIKIFEILCRLLQSVLTHRRQSIIHLIPGVCSLVSTLMECLAENEILDPSLSTSGPLRARLSGLDIDKKVSLARTLSRVLQKFSQKQGVHAGEGLSGSTSQMKPFSKHAPFLISKFVSIHASKRQYSSAVYDALLEGLYSVIDICDDFGRESVLANLDLPGTGQKGAKLLYKKLTSSWKEAARNRNKV